MTKERRNPRCTPPSHLRPRAPFRLIDWESKTLHRQPSIRQGNRAGEVGATSELARFDSVEIPSAVVVGIDGAEAISDDERCRLAESPGRTGLGRVSAATGVPSAFERGISAVLKRNTKFVWPIYSGAI
jgi:hypothetical protein